MNPEDRFTPRPRRPREEGSDPATLERITRLRALLARIGPVAADDLRDPDADTVLRVEAAIIRTYAIVRKLPTETRSRLDETLQRGLAGARNVAAHGYGDLNPELTAEIVNAHLPKALDAIEKAIRG